LAGSVYLHSLWLFLSCRFFAGCFAGCYEIAQAATADISTPETKARNMGWVSLALSVGFIFGPLITAFSTSSASFFSHSLTAPFWIAAGISSSNAILISLFLPETFVSQAEKKIKLSKIFSSFLFVFTDRRLTYLSIIFLCLVGGWMGFFTVLPLYLSNVFHFEVSRVALFYCIIGVSCVTSIFLVQSRVIKYFSLPKIITYSAFICAAILVLLSAFSSIWLFGVFLAIFAIIEMLTYSCFLVYFSNAVTPDEQGQAMGGSGATSSVAFIFCSFVTAMLANYDARLIFVFSALLFFLIGILMLRKLKT
jgi:predicted MFS family arabinose efflux permease